MKLNCWIGPLLVLVTGNTKKSQKNIVLTTGARARELTGMEADGDLVWTYKHALTPSRMPKKLLVIGSGAIGVEFASFYNTFGANTTIVEVLIEYCRLKTRTFLR